MISRSLVAPSLAVICLLLSPPLLAEVPKQPADTAAKAKVVYVPPNRGAPASRVGGGTRGDGDEGAILRALAPEHTGFASSDQPVLYWYISKPAATRLEVALIDDTAEEPLLELEMDATAKPGIRELKLADYGIRLKPNVEYQWSVALVIDPEQRSKDVLASGTVMYVPATDALQKSVAAAGAGERPSIYAAGGYWYDALEGISTLLDTASNKPELLSQRNALLEQVGLAEVAGAGIP